MKRRRYVVRLLPAYGRGERRWVVWDRLRRGWADDAQRTRRDAQDIRDELEARAETAATGDHLSRRPPEPPTT